MVQLFAIGWVWVVIGIILLVLGYRYVKVPLSQWIAFLFSLPFTITAEPTEEEKPLVERPVEEAAASSPGCTIMLVGTLFVIYGLFRWLT